MGRLLAILSNIRFHDLHPPRRAGNDEIKTMLLDEYVAKAEDVVQLTDAGDFKGALKILKGLLAADLPDLDKSVMWVNAATVYDKMKMFDEALRCYDKAMALEKRHGRFFAMERKAVYLANNHRGEESLRLYKRLLERSDLTLIERDKIAKSLRAVKQHFGI